MPYLSTSRLRRSRSLAIFAAIVLAVAAIFFTVRGGGANEEKPAPQAAPALTVQIAAATTAEWPETLQVSGPIAAWQEAIIGSEISGQRLIELRVNVGDRVKKGEVLARYNADMLQAEREELQATWQQAEADRVRAASLQDSGAMSSQQIENYANQAAIAKARLQAKLVQLRYATVAAPADGTISARSATLGAVGAAGGELFRMILDDRLEWRAELSAEQLAQVKAGQIVTLTLPEGSTAQAKIRQLSPALDAQTRLATAYADILPGSRAYAGMYAAGTIAMQVRPALVVPAVGVVIRDGRTYVFTVGDTVATAHKAEATYKVTQQAVTTGRHQGDRVEITEGLRSGARVITQGAGFLNDGDTVRIVGEAGKPL